MTANGVSQGLTTAVPFHGDGAYTEGGQWELAGRFDLNDPTQGFPLDGLRTISVTAEDKAGNLSEAATLDIFIDTQGPRVTNVFVTGNGAFNLFDPSLLKGPRRA